MSIKMTMCLSGCLFVLLSGTMLFSDIKNIKSFFTDYDTTWSACTQALADMKFIIKATEKSSGLIQAETGIPSSENPNNANEMITSYTTQKTNSLSHWKGYTIDCNLLVIKKDKNLTEIKINTLIEGYNSWSDKWETLESNGAIEKEIFDAIQIKLNASMKPEQASSEQENAKGTIYLISQPDKAHIEVDGNFAGQTPLKLALKEGKHEIKVMIRGYKTWEKNIQVFKDSKINFEAILEKE